MNARHRLPTLALICAILSGGNATAQTLANFGGWTAGCDNTRACRAVGFSASQIGYGRLIIDRAGPASAAAQIRLSLDFESEAQQIALALTFDEPGFESVFPGPVNARKHKDRFTLTLPARAQPAFLAALRKASVLTIRQLDKPANPEQAQTGISLKGAMAALRWMDDQQKRAGGVTALVANGDAPASAMPPPPALPTIQRPAFKASDIKGKMPPAVFAAWKDACDEWDDAIKISKPEGYRIAPGVDLWQAPCSRGAYNYSSNFFLFREDRKSAGKNSGPATGQASLLKFDLWNNTPKAGESRFSIASEELVNAQFDKGALTISFFSKGRGLGDCGSSGVFAWDGKRFRLARYARMDECRGALEEEWLTLWRTRAAP